MYLIEFFGSSLLLSVSQTRVILLQSASAIHKFFHRLRCLPVLNSSPKTRSEET
jgi:hypothetical protein